MSDQFPLFDIARADRDNTTRKHFGKAALLLQIVGEANANDVSFDHLKDWWKQLQKMRDAEAWKNARVVDAEIKPLARKSDVHTSHNAARSMQSIAASHRLHVLQIIRDHGAQTGHEIADNSDNCALTYQQVSKRLSELHEQGLIQRRGIGTADDGKTLYQTRNSPQGYPACVWYITPKGQAY